MMRVLFNRSCEIGVLSGVGYYSLHLFTSLQKRLGSNDLCGFPTGLVRHAQTAWGRIKPWLERADSGVDERPAASSAVVGQSPATFLRTAVWYWKEMKDRAISKKLSSEDADLYHEPNFLAVPCELPVVITVHDLSVLLHPEWHPLDRVKEYERRFQQGLARCRHILTVSEYVRRQIIRELQVPGTKITTAYNGVRPHMRRLPRLQIRKTLAKLRIQSDYILFVGTIEPRKNIQMLMEAYCSLPGPVRDKCKLLLAGTWGWKSERERQYYLRFGRDRGVRHLGYVQEKDLPALYGGATALAFPSYDEGFGLPPVEMLACGGAVLASDIEIFREVLRGHGYLIPPKDIDSWRTALALAIRDRDWLAGLRDRAATFGRPYTWERCAAKTCDVYRSVCGLPHQGARLLAGAA